VGSGARWGIVRLLFDHPEGIAIAAGFSRDTRGIRPIDTAWLGNHRSRHATSEGGGWWYRAEPGVGDLGREAARRSTTLDIGDFRRFLPTWNMPPAGQDALVLTVEATGQARESPLWSAWLANQERATWIPHEIVDTGADLLAPLDEGWPRNLLADKRVLVIGVGSIGGMACQAMAAYGIRHFALVDPDRLRSRNFARHVAPRSEHGRLKVRAVADLLSERDASVDVVALPLNADRDADQLRPLVRDSDLVVICSDGTRSRRVGCHVAFRTRKPVAMGCVQGGGAYGEVLRLVPGRTGCLLCNRAALQNALEPEPIGFDLDYDVPGEAGHQMTAVTGDLWLVGQLTGKVAVATLMQPHGDRSQRLAGDMALIALRPEPDFPAPFEALTEAGQLIWADTAPSRAECPTCGAGHRA
jgi:molybdopterin-synthase adenylyltransferase